MLLQNAFDSLGGWTGLGITAVVLFGLIFFLMLAKQYKRCPSNKVLVIYGRVKSGTSARCLHGGGAFVVPLIQSYDYLNLDPIQIEVPLRGALSIENIRVNVPSVFTVAIGTEEHVMQNAAVRLLGLSTKDIMKQAEDIIFGQLRQVIASMGIEEINRDRDKFLENIQTSLEGELMKIGLVLINVNITDITDESNYIEAIGKRPRPPPSTRPRSTWPSRSSWARSARPAASIPPTSSASPRRWGSRASRTCSNCSRPG